MNICKTHWSILREALDARGIGHIGAQSGNEAVADVVADINEKPRPYDPLMDCNYMIANQGLKMFGIAMLTPLAGEEKPPCPVCTAVAAYERDWIEGPANAALKVCVERGLVPAGPDKV